MTKPTPTTVTTEYLWDRTRFELVDSRSLILTTFESLGLLRAFTLPHNDLYMTLTDSRHVQVTLDSVSVYEAVRTDSHDDNYISSSEIAAIIGQQLNVVGVLPAMSFQHLIPWSTTDAPAAFKRASHAVVPDAEPAGVTDFALLLDGQWNEDWTYQVEFGVVEEAAVLTRLRRRIGRSSAFAPSGSVDFEQDFPDVGTFLDSRWRLSKTDTPVALADAERVVTSVYPMANELALLLHNRISG